MSRSGNSSFFYGWIILAASFAVSMMFSVFFSFGVFFKPMMNEFGWTRAATALTPSIRSLVYTLCVIPMALMYDRFGPRLTIFFGGALAGLGILLCSRILTIGELYLFFGVLAGVGTSCVFVPFASSIMKWFTHNKGLMMGIYLSGSGVGSLIWPLAEDHIISVYGWRAAFQITGLVYLTVVLSAALVMKNPPEGLRPEFDEVSIGDNIKEFQPTTSKDKVSRWLIVREIFQRRSFWSLYFIFVISTLITGIYIVHMVPFTIDTGLSPIIAASALSLIGLFSIVAKVTVGRITDRITVATTFFTCYVIQTIAILFILNAANLWMIYAFSALFGFSRGGWSTIEPLIVGEFFGTRLGVILGIFETAFGIGGAAGPFLGGYLYDLTGSYYAAFVLTAVLSILTALIALTVRKKGK